MHSPFLLGRTIYLLTCTSALFVFMLQESAKPSWGQGHILNPNLNVIHKWKGHFTGMEVGNGGEGGKNKRKMEVRQHQLLQL